MTVVIRMPPHASTRSLVQWAGQSIELAFHSDASIWLRCPSGNPLDASWDQIPGQRYQSVDQDRLVKLGDRVASAVLPADLSWQPLDRALQWTLPTARLAGRLPSGPKRVLSLVRGGAQSDALGVIVDRDVLVQWADTASEVRLRRLQFSVAGRRAIVLGTPLPAVDGVFLVNKDRILVPAGWTWTPTISSGAVRDVFAVRPDEYLVWQPDQRHWLISEDAFSPLIRGTIRRWAGGEDAAKHAFAPEGGP